MNWSNLIILLAISLLNSLALADSYYKILNVTKSATINEIKKSYKKLALKLHPDRNQDSPTAQEDYITLHKAYEVLIDQKKRGIYDRYGEEGLEKAEEQSFQPSSSYAGIYDDDEEVVSMGYGHFTASTTNSQKIWLVNFHMPNCDPCHRVADDYRQIARSFEHVIGVAAVNCMADYNVCNRERVMGYPSIKLYPSGSSYPYSDYSVEKLTKFIFSKLPHKVKLLEHSNFDTVAASSDSKPWFLAVTTGKIDESDHDHLKKISLSLMGLVNVGYLYCEKFKQNPLCQTLEDSEESIISVYLSKSLKQPDQHQIVDGMHYSTIMEHYLSQPDTKDVEFVDGTTIKKYIKLVESGSQNPFAVLFLNSHSISSTKLERIKLISLVNNTSVYAVNCDNDNICQELDITKLPRVGLFKKEGKELHYGLFYSEEINYFIKMAIKSNNILVTSTSTQINTIYTKPTLFYFFNSMCQPCIHKIWFWRELYAKIKSNKDQFQLLSIDCSTDMLFCQQHNIYGMPSIKAFNRTVLDTTSDFESINDIIEFIKDLGIIYVTELTPNTYKQLIDNKKDEEIWFVDHYAPWCGPCMQMMPEFKKTAKKYVKTIKFAKIDCSNYSSFCSTLRLDYYPNLRLFPMRDSSIKTSTSSSKKPNYITYSGWNNMGSFVSFLTQYLPSDVFVIRNDNYLELMEANKDRPILIDFYAAWCQPCHLFSPIYEQVAQKAKKSLKNLLVAKVECTQNTIFCSKYTIKHYPYIMLIHPTSTKKQREIIDSQPWDADRILRLVSNKISSYAPKTEL